MGNVATPLPISKDQSGVIYSIIDPRNGKVIYIGKAVNFKQRRSQHLRTLKRGDGNNRLGNIYRKLTRMKLRLRFKVLEDCLFGLGDRERWWIAHGRAKGWPLCNVTEGGECGTWDEEWKAKASEKTKALWADDGYRQRCSSAIKERWANYQRKPDPTREAGLAQHRENMRIHAERVAWKNLKVYPVTRGDTAFVPLSDGKWATIDAEDWERVSQHRWYANKNGNGWRARHGTTKAMLRQFIAPGALWRYGNQLDCRRSAIRSKPAPKPVDVEASS